MLFDMAVLLGAQQIARSPDLEVAQSYLKPEPNSCNRVIAIQPLFGDLGQRAALWIGKISVGAAI